MSHKSFYFGDIQELNRALAQLGVESSWRSKVSNGHSTCDVFWQDRRPIISHWASTGKIWAKDEALHNLLERTTAPEKQDSPVKARSRSPRRSTAFDNLSPTLNFF